MDTEIAQGLVLIDTGPGLDDYLNPPDILRLFQIITDKGSKMSRYSCTSKLFRRSR